MAIGKNWPLWAKNFISKEEAERISQIVEQSESQTSGEIVPMIVRRSSTIGHVPFMLTLLFLLILFVFEIPQMNFLHLKWVLLIFAIALFLISFPLSHLYWVQRLFVPALDRSFQVENRALLEFYTTGITATAERTGVLIFISLMERKAVILADQGISQKLPPETWSEICREMVVALKQGKTAEGMGKAIQRSGELLAQHFPARPENQNELSNQLILKE